MSYSVESRVEILRLFYIAALVGVVGLYPAPPNRTAIAQHPTSFFRVQAGKLQTVSLYTE